MGCLEELLKSLYRKGSFNVKVEPSKAIEILKILSLLPSQANLQPWEIVVVDDDSVKEKVFDATLDPLLRDEEDLKPAWIKSAPVLIVVCADTDRVVRRYGLRGREYAIQDAFAATLAIALRAVELGYLPSVVREFDKKRLQEAIKASSNIEPVAIIALGKPEGEAKIVKPSLEIEDFTYRNAWGQESWTS